MGVLPAASVQDAIAALARRPHSILLALMLPDGSGAGVLRHVRAKRLPARVAVTTGTTDEHLLAEVEHLRPDAVFRKPLDLPAVEQWLAAEVPTVA